MVVWSVGDKWAGLQIDSLEIYSKKNPGKEVVLTASSLGLFFGQADYSALKTNTQVYSTELRPSGHFFLYSDHSIPLSPSEFFRF
jgi:hypothetical protein